MTALPRRATASGRGADPLGRDSRQHRLFGLKAAQEAGRVLKLFERHRPRDGRPRKAIDAILAWSRGERALGMPVVRKLALDAHAAARASTSTSAREAARAAGHAVATWHAPTHAMAVSAYAWKARYAAKDEAASAKRRSAATPRAKRGGR
jgi:hypothetical protein